MYALEYQSERIIRLQPPTTLYGWTQLCKF